MLVQYISPSPRANHANNKEHVSREVGEVLIRAGFARAIDDPDFQRAQGNLVQYPPRGWKILNLDKTGAKHRIAIIFDDGLGSRTFYLDKLGNPCVPGPIRKWVYNTETGEEGYQSVPTDCPQAVIDEFLRLGGGAPNNPDADLDAGSIYRQRLIEREAAQETQNRLACTFLRVHGVRK